MALTAPQNPFPWMLDHLSYVGWSTFIYACYRIIRMSFNIGATFTIARERVLEGEKTLMLMATNHLPHLQLELEKQNVNHEKTHTLLTEVRDGIKDLKRA